MRIMLVEDSAVERREIADYLEGWNLEFTVAKTGADAWRLIHSPNAPNLVLLDWMLPDVDGIELCRRIRMLSANGNYIYAVMLTAKDRKSHLLTAMAAGADDYLSKPVDPSELRARILVGKRILELQQSLRFAATHDFLTKLSNREEILAALTREIARSERERKPATLIMADLDHFKNVNDSLGHAAGDSVLKEVAQRLGADLRAYDLVGRYGGEEFLLILPNCSLVTGTRRADEIRCRISQDPVITTFAKVQVTVSMGVTTTGSADPTIESLLQEADHALYSAKQKGRNRVEAFAPEQVASRQHEVHDRLAEMDAMHGKEEPRLAKHEGFSLIELLVAMAIILVIAGIAIPKLLHAKIAANESSAVASVHTITAANISYSNSYPTVGFPAALSNLGPNGSSCGGGPTSAKACIIDAVLASGTKSGYKIGDTGSNKVGTPLTKFVISATPSILNSTGVKGFCAAEDGVVRWVSPASGAISYATCTTLSSLK